MFRVEYQGKSSHKTEHSYKIGKKIKSEITKIVYIYILGNIQLEIYLVVRLYKKNSHSIA